MEKGGAKVPVKGLRPSIKSTPPSSVKGKDDNSAMSKKGRKVQFDPEGSTEAKFDFSSKSDGKFGSLHSKGGLSKGGKGGKVPASKEPQPLELKLEQELPNNATCIMDCEAAEILQGIQEQMVLLSQDPTIKLPASFDRAFQYAKKGSHYKNPQSIRQVLEALKVYGVSDGEICAIANVCPENVDEAFALIPSLKSKKSTLKEPLKDVLSEVQKLKQLS